MIMFFSLEENVVILHDAYSPTPSSRFWHATNPTHSRTKKKNCRETHIHCLWATQNVWASVEFLLQNPYLAGPNTRESFFAPPAPPPAKDDVVSLINRLARAMLNTKTHARTDARRSRDRGRDSRDRDSYRGRDSRDRGRSSYGNGGDRYRRRSRSRDRGTYSYYGR